MLSEHKHSVLLPQLAINSTLDQTIASRNVSPNAFKSRPLPVVVSERTSPNYERRSSLRQSLFNMRPRYSNCRGNSTKHNSHAINKSIMVGTSTNEGIEALPISIGSGASVGGTTAKDSKELQLHQTIICLKRQINTKNLEVGKMKEQIESLKKTIESVQSINLKLIHTLESHGIQLPRDVGLVSAQEIVKENTVPSVYVETITKERDQALLENKSLKQQISQIKIQSDQYKSEIAKLQAIIKRYRKIVHDFESGEILSRNSTIHQSNSVISALSDLEPEKGSAFPKSKARLAALQSLIETIKKSTSITRIVSSCIKEVPKIIECQKFIVYIFDTSLSIINPVQAPLLEPHCKFHKVLYFKSWAEAIYTEAGYSDPAFSSLEHARKGFRTPEALVASVMGSKDKRAVPIVFQVERNKPGFTFFDEVVLRHLCNVLSFKIEVEKLKAKNKKHGEKYKELVNLAVGLLSARSQIGLIKAMREHLPKFYGFEDLGLLFYNEKKGQLYTIYENPLLQGSNNIQAISFPSGMGVCGEIVKSPQIRLKDYRANQVINSDIDNLLSKKELKNFLFAPLFDSSGKLNGIIQLVNKINGGEVKESDIAQFKEIAKVYGLLVERVNEKDHIMHTLVGLKSTADMIAGVVSGGETLTEGGSQIVNLVKSMRTANTIVSDMMSPKRALILEGLSGATILSKLQPLQQKNQQQQ